MPIRQELYIFGDFNIDFSKANATSKPGVFDVKELLEELNKMGLILIQTPKPCPTTKKKNGRQIDWCLSNRADIKHELFLPYINWFSDHLALFADIKF